MRSTYIAFAAGLIALTWLASPAFADGSARDWPQWRGPDQNLISLGNGAFDGGEFGLEVVWKKPLGPGYSSVSVAGGRAVTMFSDGRDDLLVALDAATGRELWRYRIAPTYEGHSASEDGPRSTPGIDRGQVYALGPHGHLVMVRLEDGAPLWRRDLKAELGAREAQYGFSTAPIVADGVLVVETGGAGSAVSGFDPATGELLWSAGDDTVGSQSPILADLHGERQVVAVTSHFLFGLAPRTGEVLWRHRHTDEPRHEWGWTQPVIVDGDKVLAHYWDDAALFAVAKTDGGYAVSELWRSADLKLNTLMPIYYGGYLYGYNQRFLSCLDPRTGKKVWKSRPPGYGGLALVDGHLVTVGPEGVLAVVEASPDGYREKARLPVLGRHTLAPPSFADGRIFVRDMAEIAAVAVTREARPAALAEDSPPPGGELGRLLERLGPADDKDRIVDEFLDGLRETPVVEGDRVVHFVYRGPAREVGLEGSMLDVGDQVSLERVAGTDLFYRSVRLEPSSIWQYRFVVDFENEVPDPGNPRRTAGPDGEWSLVATPGWEEPPHLAECSSCAAGRLESFTLASEFRGDEREVRVYLPAGYGDGERRYPLLVVHHGDRALEFGGMKNTLDHLIGTRIEPIVVAFVPATSRNEYSGRSSEAWARMIVDELLPRLESTYRLRSGAAARAVMGTGEAGLAAAYVALEHPGVFSKVAVQSYLRLEAGDRILARIRDGGARPITWYVEWSRHDLRSEPGLDQARWWARDARTASRELAQALEDQGCAVTAVEVASGAGWASWRSRTDRILEHLYPKPDTFDAR